MISNNVISQNILEARIYAKMGLSYDQNGIPYDHLGIRGCGASDGAYKKVNKSISFKKPKKIYTILSR